MSDKTETRESARDLYYRICAEAWESVDKSNPYAIHAYNEYRRELRHALLDEE